MNTYVIGDLQGCHQQTLALLDRIAQAEAGAAAPTILFAGDLINRGPDSLATLRHVRALPRPATGASTACSATTTCTCWRSPTASGPNTSPTRWPRSCPHPTATS